MAERFPQAAELESSIGKEFYPPSVKCRVRYTLPKAERSVPMTLTLALSERDNIFSFTFDIMAGSTGMDTCMHSIILLRICCIAILD